MNRKKCETCGRTAPAKSVNGYQVIMQHQAPCGLWCFVGAANGEPALPDTTHFHGPDKCGLCGEVKPHWRKGRGER